MKIGRNITYWILTLLVAVPFLGSGIGYVLNAAPIAAGMERLGYPPYLTPFIGIAKLLAVLAILVGRFPRLKDWAYAGLVFDTVGAVYSHVCAGETREVVPAAVILVVLALSYRSWKKSNFTCQPKAARHDQWFVHP
jgi:uncharacterized membrane protein YphA (DoxX/SURF4 family)